MPQALIVAMDSSIPSHQLSLMVARKAKMFANGKPTARLEYQNNAPAKDKLYTAAAVRAASANMLIGFRDRSHDIRENNVLAALPEFSKDGNEKALERASTWVAGAWDYAFERMPGWKDLAKDKGKSPADFRETYLLGSAAGLYTVAGVLAAARLAGLRYQDVVEALAELPWRRNDIVTAKDGKPRHRFFEGTLANTVQQVSEDGKINTVVRTGGGNRTSYEAAAKAVLTHLAKSNELADLGKPEVWREIGLLPIGKKGRPRTKQ
jgi:hypothetical protein